jgi:hypothetical protein
MSREPRTTYSQLLEKRRAAVADEERRHRAFGYGKLAAVLAAVGVVWGALQSGAFSVAWALAPAGVFVTLLIVHDRLLKRLERLRRAARYFELGLARLDGKWIGHGEPGDRYLDPNHPYAQDLDIFGKGSLFELLCAARTHIGEETLARWLLAPAPAPEVRERQDAIRELIGRLDLREDLAVLGEEARTGVDSVSLAAWGEAPPALGTFRMRATIWGLTVLGLIGLAAVGVLSVNSAELTRFSESVVVLSRDLFLLVLLVNGTFLYRKRALFDEMVAAVDEAGHELGLLSEVLVRLEHERFQAPRLAALRSSLDAADEPPSRRIARLNRLLELVDSRDNVFVRVAEVFILWTPHLAMRVEDWRRQSGTAVRRWLTATGEIEALSSLANHAFEHPADAFPELSEEGFGIEAEGLAHPLIPEDRVVRNDLRIGGEGPKVLIVSGSNMSGKSTLLRTVGVNAVLAQAGAPVRARRLRISPLAVGASIRVTDSLQSGVSRFYAEILRLRQILDATGGALTVLFLIDEFLHGTNSHDRRIGAEALVRGLVERGAIGLITTHDLALAEIVEALGSRAANVHFEDQIEDGRIRFDYRMRPGVVRKSNAIELMRSVGLEI